MDKFDLEERTKRFALAVIRFVSGMPRAREADVVGRQLLRSATSIGANYREANRAQSRADFIHKVAIVEKEAAETQYWLELCRGAGIGEAAPCNQLLDESTQLLAIFTTIGRTAKHGREGKFSKFEIRNSQ
jgi:four helix bundle protein